MDIPITRADKSKLKGKPADDSKLGFGQYFSDHMFLMQYHPDKGWHAPRIEPHAPLALDPAAMVLHYGQAVFEGLKAYRGKDGGIYLFRHMKNLERLERSCDRLEIPQFPIDVAARGLVDLVLLERDWIPVSKGSSLYIRPTVIAVDPFLGVKPSATYLFYVIVGPVGAYYPEGFNPIKIWVSEHWVRAVRGGVGDAKTAGNYAASLKAQMQARKAGYAQVLWLDAIERRYVEEVGTMNMFFVLGNEVVTAPLSGSILPGVTRDSVIQLCRNRGLVVSERPLAIDEVAQGARTGELVEAFGTGTAAIISPVGAFHWKGTEHRVGDGQVGKLSRSLFDELLDMQYGHRPAPDGWVERIDR